MEIAFQKIKSTESVTLHFSEDATEADAKKSLSELEGCSPDIITIIYQSRTLKNEPLKNYVGNCQTLKYHIKCAKSNRSKPRLTENTTTTNSQPSNSKPQNEPNEIHSTSPSHENAVTTNSQPSNPEPNIAPNEPHSISPSHQNSDITETPASQNSVSNTSQNVSPTLEKLFTQFSNSTRNDNNRLPFPNNNQPTVQHHQQFQSQNEPTHLSYEDSLQTMKDMGLDEQKSIRALKVSRDLTEAIERVISGQVPDEQEVSQTPQIPQQNRKLSPSEQDYVLAVIANSPNLIQKVQHEERIPCILPESNIVHHVFIDSVLFNQYLANIDPCILGLPENTPQIINGQETIVIKNKRSQQQQPTEPTPTAFPEITQRMSSTGVRLNSGPIPLIPNIDRSEPPMPNSIKGKSTSPGQTKQPKNRQEINFPLYGHLKLQVPWDDSTPMGMKSFIDYPNVILSTNSMNIFNNQTVEYMSPGMGQKDSQHLHRCSSLSMESQETDPSQVLDSFEPHERADCQTLIQEGYTLPEVVQYYLIANKHIDDARSLLHSNKQKGY